MPEMDHKPGRNFYADEGLCCGGNHLFDNTAQQEHVTSFDATLSTPDVAQNLPATIRNNADRKM